MNQIKDTSQDELETLDDLVAIRSDLKARIVGVSRRSELPGKLIDSVKQLAKVQVTRLR
jgi:hypothetical protein